MAGEFSPGGRRGHWHRGLRAIGYNALTYNALTYNALTFNGLSDVDLDLSCGSAPLQLFEYAVTCPAAIAVYRDRL